MNYYNVIIRDNLNVPDNQLVFTFFSIEEAIKFEKKILQNSDYAVTILYIEEKNE